MRRLLLTLLALCLAGCGARHHANSVLAAYKTAVAQNDVPAFVRLAEPNMRALIERDAGLLKEDTVAFIDTITANPVRVVTSPKGVVYLGWERERSPCRGSCGWNLMPLVVGEGRSISKYSELAESAGTNETTDWQVSALTGRESWRLAGVRNANDQAAINKALATVSDDLLRAWFFEGSIDARRSISASLGTHH